MVGSLTIAKPGSDGTTTLEWDGDAPFFASCRMRITLFHAPGVRNELESEQADNRITYQDLKVKVPEQVRARKLRPCGRCGAKLYLEGKEARSEHGEGPPKREREPTGGTPQRATTSRTSTFDQLQQLMEWQRQGLLSEVEFQRAKDKVLGEEPKYASHCMLACSAKASKKSMAGQEVTRAEGPQSARLFAIGIILEPIWVGQK